MASRGHGHLTSGAPNQTLPDQTRSAVFPWQAHALRYWQVTGSVGITGVPEGPAGAYGLIPTSRMATLLITLADAA